MAYSLIPTDDHALATRVKRQLKGFMSYLMFLVPPVYSVRNHWVEFGYAGCRCWAATSRCCGRAWRTRRMRWPSRWRG